MRCRIESVCAPAASVVPGVCGRAVAAAAALGALDAQRLWDNHADDEDQA